MKDSSADRKGAYMKEGIKRNIYITTAAVLLLALLLSTSAFAQANDRIENTLAERGFEGFTVSEKNTRQCETYVFATPTESEKYFPIATLEMEFHPTIQGNAKALISMNGGRAQEFEMNDLMCMDLACEVHAYLNRNELKESNELEVCLKTSDSIARAELKDSTVIGFYQTPVFRATDFNQMVEDNPVILNKRTKVNLYVRNSGTADAVADVNFARPVVEKKIDHVKVIGNTNFVGETIRAGEMRVFSYELLADRPLAFSIPPAALTWTNVFGEQLLMRTRPIITRTEEALNLRADILVEPAVNQAGKLSTAKVFVTNESSTDVYNASIELWAPGVVIEQKIKTIAHMAPKETKQVDFKLSSTASVQTSVGCTLSLPDVNETAECLSGTASFEAGNTTQWLIIQGIVLFVIGTIIVAFLNRK